jgi:gamma-glutamylcyclotransferase (GGCT)/AIG2-like uncharacterized protein YtfP
VTKRITVYGSLKKGKYNNVLLKDSKFIGDTEVKGTLYSLGSYPALVNEGENAYPAEVYEVSDEVYERVSRMELGAGYVEVADIKNNSTVYYAGSRLAEYCHENAKQIDSY